MVRYRLIELGPDDGRFFATIGWNTRPPVAVSADLPGLRAAADNMPHDHWRIFDRDTNRDPNPVRIPASPPHPAVSYPGDGRLFSDDPDLRQIPVRRRFDPPPIWIVWGSDPHRSIGPDDYRRLPGCARKTPQPPKRYRLLEQGPDDSSTYAECWGAYPQSPGRLIASAMTLQGKARLADGLVWDQMQLVRGGPPVRVDPACWPPFSWLIRALGHANWAIYDGETGQQVLSPRSQS